MKTSELTGAALDWAVAKCEGYFEIDMAVVRNGAVRVHYFDKWSPTTDWSQGGPIIERECIQLTTTLHTDLRKPDTWGAYLDDGRDIVDSVETGPTPLIAAMRCFVASRLGDDVEIPEELRS